MASVHLKMGLAYWQEGDLAEGRRQCLAALAIFERVPAYTTGLDGGARMGGMVGAAGAARDCFVLTKHPAGDIEEA